MPIPSHKQLKKNGKVCNVIDNLRKPINSTDRQKRIAGKREEELYPYYGATGEFILIKEDGATFLDIYKYKA